VPALNALSGLGRIENFTTDFTDEHEWAMIENFLQFPGKK
jgi:hypothetical protein